MCEVKKSVEELLEVAHSGQAAVKEAPVNAIPAVLIHLFALLFEDCSRLCVQLVENSGAIDLIVPLTAVALQSTCRCLSTFTLKDRNTTYGLEP